MTDESIFTLDGDGYSDIGKSRFVPEGKEEEAELGVYNCPVSALFLEEA